MDGIARRNFLIGAAVVGTGLTVGGLRLNLAQAAEAGVAPGTAPSVVGCDEWGAAAPRSTITLLNKRPVKIIVHHTDTPNSADYSRPHAFALARSIQQGHFGHGWVDSGQHFTLSRGGIALEGRHQSSAAAVGGTRHVLGAHCTGQNEVAVGIENEGTYSTEAPPPMLYAKLVTVSAYLCRQYGIPATQIFGHRDFFPTECPGNVLYGMLSQLRADVAAHVGGGDGIGEHSRSWPLVSSGQSGERVRTVQYLLRMCGYAVGTDGTYSGSTVTGVRSFQSARGLSPDGIVGPWTWEALIITVGVGTVSDVVRAVQFQLRARGYRVPVDGAFGMSTQAAVRAFQSSRGVSPDGVVGPETWSKLVG